MQVREAIAELEQLITTARELKKTPPIAKGGIKGIYYLRSAKKGEGCFQQDCDSIINGITGIVVELRKRGLDDDLTVGQLQEIFGKMGRIPGNGRTPIERVEPLLDAFTTSWATFAGAIRATESVERVHLQFLRAEENMERLTKGLPPLGASNKPA